MNHKHIHNRYHSEHSRVSLAISMPHRDPLHDKSSFNSEVLLSGLRKGLHTYFKKKFNSDSVIDKFTARQFESLTQIFSNIEISLDFFSSKQYLIDRKGDAFGKKPKKKMDAFGIKSQSTSILSALETAQNLYDLNSYMPHTMPLSENSLNQLKSFFVQVYAMREKLLECGSTISGIINDPKSNTQKIYERVELAKLSDSLKRLHTIQSALAEYASSFNIVYESPEPLTTEARGHFPTLKERKALSKVKKKRKYEAKMASRNHTSAPKGLSAEAPVATSAILVQPTENAPTTAAILGPPVKPTGITVIAKELFFSFISSLHLPGKRNEPKKSDSPQQP